MPETAGAGFRDRLRCRPVYAPALVAFVGGVGISVGGGPGVGWFPLAPGEVYVPYYRGSRDYVERVNVTNTVVNVTRVTNVYNQRNVTNITYVNQRVNNSVTLVSRDTFVNARPVARNLGHVDARQLAEAPVQRDVQVQPVRASVLGSGAPARFSPPQAIVNRQVVATQRPAPPRQPFEQRQAAVNVRTERPSDQPRPLGNQRQAIGLQSPGGATASSLSSPAAGCLASSECRVPEARPQQPMVAPRVAEPARPEGQMPPRPPQGAVNQNDNNRVSQGWSHPQAKPAPPVQQRNPAQARDDENKFRNWQQQRQQAAPAQNHAPQRRPAPGPAGARQAAKIAELSRPVTLNCQFPNRRLAIFFAYLQIAACTIDYWEPGTEKLGTGFLCKSASYSSASSRISPARPSDSLNLPENATLGDVLQSLRASHPATERYGIVTGHVRQSGVCGAATQG